jgi:hypothetical protein
MADETYDPFNLRKHPGYYAELVQERDPTQDVAASYVKNHQYDGGILGQLERNPHGLGDSPLPFDPSGAELRSTSEGGSAFTERPKDHMQPVAELISPTLGAFGAGQMAGTAYKEAGEGDYQDAGMSLAPLLAGMVVPGAPKGVRGPKAIPREIDARGFYSPSLEAVKGLGQEAGTVQQFRSMLLKAGGKPKELEAVGFDKAFPDPNAKVSRQDIEQYLRDNRVSLGRETLGPLESTTNKQSKYNIPQVVRAARESGDTPGDLELTLANDGDAYRALMQRFPELQGNEDWASIVAQDVFGGPDRPSGASKYDSYSTPGGIPGSYREVVTTLPNRSFDSLYDFQRAITKKYGFNVDPETAFRMSPEDQAAYEGLRSGNKDQTYTSSHWPGITNPVLHYRQKDFLNHADPTSVGALEKVTQPGAAGEAFWSKMKDVDAALSGEHGRAIDDWVGGPHNMDDTGMVGGLMMPGRLESLSPAEWERMAQPVRAQLRQTYGETIPVYRAENLGGQSTGRQNKLNSYTTDRRVAESMAGVRPEQPIIGVAEIAQAEQALKRTGEATLGGTTFRYNPQDKSIDMYTGNQYVTDTPSIRHTIDDLNAYRAEINAASAAARAKVRETRLPVDAVVWATDRFNQKELIAKGDMEAPSPQSGSGEGTTARGAQRSPELNQPSKVRVLDEMQSDWAQRARDNGIRSGDATQLKAQRDVALKARDDVYAEIDALAKKHGYEPSNNTEGRGFILKMMRHDAIPGTQELTDRMLQAGNDYLDLSSKYSAASQGVPSAPYISNNSVWVDLGL